MPTTTHRHTDDHSHSAIASVYVQTGANATADGATASSDIAIFSACGADGSADSADSNANGADTSADETDAIADITNASADEVRGTVDRAYKNRRFTNTRAWPLCIGWLLKTLSYVVICMDYIFLGYACDAVS